MLSDQLLRQPRFLPPATVSRETEVRWFAVHTRSRHEKKVAQQFAEKQIHYLLPLVSETHRWSDRRKVVKQPMFPGYVFVQICESHTALLSILTTSGVVGLVGAQGRGIPIPDKQIEDIQMILEANVPFVLFPFLEVGQRVRIRGGCLDGVEGVLLAKNEDKSLIVSIDLIQRSLAVRVEGYEVETIKSNASSGRSALTVCAS